MPVEKVQCTHEDLIHDVKFDYYGKQLATCSSDRKVKIFAVVGEGGERQEVAELLGHDGPVWEVSWAHPEYGNILASCSYDRSVFVWKEHAPGSWAVIHKFLDHEGSVNSVAFCPREFGLRLACASSDDRVSVLTHGEDGRWDVKWIKAHKTGVNSVAWAPLTESGEMKLISGGCDNLVKIWLWDPAKDSWVESVTLPQMHTDWVRGVAWAPEVGPGCSMVASCSQDKRAIVWICEGPEADWEPKVIQFSCVVWSVSWSVTGSILACAGGDNAVTLWKEDMTGEWKQIGALDEEKPPGAPPQ